MIRFLSIFSLIKSVENNGILCVYKQFGDVMSYRFLSILVYVLDDIAPVVYFNMPQSQNVFDAIISQTILHNFILLIMFTG